MLRELKGMFVLGPRLPVSRSRKSRNFAKQFGIRTESAEMLDRLLDEDICLLTRPFFAKHSDEVLFTLFFVLA